MAYIRRRLGKFTVAIRRKHGQRIYKTFDRKSDAQSFAKETELQIQLYGNGYDESESPAYISPEEKKDILKSIPVSPLVKKKKIKRTLVVEKPKPKPKPPIINLLELEDWLNELDKNWWEEEHEPAPWDEKVLLQVPRSQLKGIASIMNLHKKLA